MAGGEIVRTKLTIKKMGSSKIDILMNFTHRAMIGNKKNDGKIILDKSDPTTIRL